MQQSTKYMDFIISDEKVVNSHGGRIMTGGEDASGINIIGYDRNMPVYYNHDWIIGAMPIGKTEKLEKNKGQLIGTPIFDTEDLDDETKRVIHKVEKGFIKGASVGVDIITVSEAPDLILQGQTRPTIVQSNLFEWSVTGLPANQNCVKLSSSKRGVMLSPLADKAYLNKLLPIIEKSEKKMKEVLSKLGLPADADEQAVVKAIEALQKQSVEMVLSIGRSKGLVTDANEADYRALASKDYAATLSVVNSHVEPKVGIPADAKDNNQQTIAAAIAALGKGNQGNDNDNREAWDFGTWSKEDPKGLQKIKEETPEKYAALARAYQG